MADVADVGVTFRMSETVPMDLLLLLGRGGRPGERSGGTTASRWVWNPHCRGSRRDALREVGELSSRRLSAIEKWTGGGWKPLPGISLRLGELDSALELRSLLGGVLNGDIRSRAGGMVAGGASVGIRTAPDTLEGVMETRGFSVRSTGGGIDPCIAFSFCAGLVDGSRDGAIYIAILGCAEEKCAS